MFSLFAIYMMLLADVYVTLYVFLPLTIVLVCVQLFRKKIEGLQKEMRDHSAKVSAFIGEMFSVVQAVQISGAEKHVHRKFSEVNNARLSVAVKESAMNAIVNSTYQNVVSIGSGFILLLAASRMNGGDFTVGDFAMFTYYLTWVTQMIVRFGGLAASYQSKRWHHSRGGNSGNVAGNL